MEVFLRPRLLDPQSGRREKLGDEFRVESVTGAMGGDLSDDRSADQSEVADQVEDFVTDEFVAETERAAGDMVIVEHDTVLDRTSAGKAGRAQFLNVAHETKGSSWSDFSGEVLRVQIEMKTLAADAGMGKVDLVADGEMAGRSDADALVAFADLHRLADAENADRVAQLSDSGRVKKMDEGKGAAIDDRNLGPVDVNLDVCDSVGDDGRKEVLDRSDGNVVFADRRRVVERRGGSLECRDAQAAQIGADECDS